VSEARIIIPLDFSDQDQASSLIRKLDPERCRLKVGKELFTSTGPAFVEKLINAGYDVFLDLKYHDIPSTVAKACCIAADLGVWMINVHASGGVHMMSLASESIEKHQHKPLLIAVTVLTSMNDAELAQTGVGKSVTEQVMHLARLAKESNLDGVVCSAQETTTLRIEFGNDFCLVTPGIRPAGSANDDQQRIMTPVEAIKAGSNYLVIGRPITQAADPLQALLAIEEEIENVRCEM
jgi:orotidine-5'-phosphate decarboxylase